MEICVLHSKYKVFWGSRVSPSYAFWCHFGTIFDQKSDKKSMQKSMPKKLWNLMPKWSKMMPTWVQKSWFFEFVCEKVTLWKCEFYWGNTGFFEVSPIKNPSTIHPRTIKKSSKIHARKSDAKRMEKWSKMEPKWGPKSLKNPSKNQSKNRCEKVCLLKKFRKWSNRLNYLQFNKTTYR